MKPATVEILCDPITHDPLRLEKDGLLANQATGRTYTIRQGIPCLLPEEDLTGQNLRYQGLYDKIARGYDLAEKVVADLTWGGRDNVRREILRQNRVPPDARVLEVSIGTGINLRYLPSQAEYFGLDISFGMLRQCQRNLPRWSRQAELIQGSAEHLPFIDSVFDVVFHFGGINFFSDRQRALHEMVRVARPGTTLMVGDETEDLAKAGEKSRLPFASKFYQGRTAEITPPAQLLPPGMLEIRSEEVWHGKFYILTFKKPG